MFAELLMQFPVETADCGLPGITRTAVRSSTLRVPVEATLATPSTCANTYGYTATRALVRVT